MEKRKINRAKENEQKEYAFLKVKITRTREQNMTKRKHNSIIYGTNALIVYFMLVRGHMRVKLSQYVNAIPATLFDWSSVILGIQHVNYTKTQIDSTLYTNTYDKYFSLPVSK